MKYEAGKEVPLVILCALGVFVVIPTQAISLQRPSMSITFER